jgi:phosphate transport system substrate-binding protein
MMVKGLDTILKVTILVDETLKPIIDDQVAVFESRYDAFRRKIRE